MRWLAVAIACLVLGNVAILAAHLLLQRSAPRPIVSLPINNFAMVDDHLWRGAAPGAEDYKLLAEQGVTTVVDLRAEDGIHVDDDALQRLGITRVHMPLRDGQSPTTEMVDRFLEITTQSKGRVYVHCGAGVGRTGTMAAAYLVEGGDASAMQAVRRNLSVGPPSLEQLAFAAGLRGDEIRRPPVALVALSRVLDAPRRTWVHLRGSYTKD